MFFGGIHDNYSCRLSVILASMEPVCCVRIVRALVYKWSLLLVYKWSLFYGDSLACLGCIASIHARHPFKVLLNHFYTPGEFKLIKEVKAE